MSLIFERVLIKSQYFRKPSSIMTPSQLTRLADGWLVAGRWLAGGWLVGDSTLKIFAQNKINKKGIGSYK